MNNHNCTALAKQTNGMACSQGQLDEGTIKEKNSFITRYHNASFLSRLVVRILLVIAQLRVGIRS